MTEVVWDEDGFMARVMNNERIAEKLISLLKSDTPKTIDELEQVINAGQVEEAGLVAHKLKGSASNLGGIKLAELALKMEKAGRELDLEELKRLCPDVRPWFDELIACIDKR